MLNFEYYNPTRVLFGDERISELPKRLPAGARLLVLYGVDSARDNGTLDEVLDALGSFDLFEFGGISANPTVEALLPAVDLARAEQADYVLAIGGGSVIDAAKFVAIAARFKGEPLEVLTHRARITDALPLAVVLTLASTGSEVSPTAVITHEASKTRHLLLSEKLYPQLAILEPGRTFTLDARQIGNGVICMFVQILEQYLTYPVNSPGQDRLAESLLLALIEEGPKALAAARDYDTRANLMWLSMVAMNGLVGAGVPHDWSTRQLAHELTALYGLDHARALAALLPATLKVRQQAKHDKLVQFAERVWGLTEGDGEQRIRYAIARTSRFFESMGVPAKLSAYELGDNWVEAVLAQLGAHNMMALGEKRDVNLEVSEQILHVAL